VDRKILRELTYISLLEDFKPQAPNNILFEL